MENIKQLIERLTAELEAGVVREVGDYNKIVEELTIERNLREAAEFTLQHDRALRSQQAAVPDVDWLSNVIRSADGGNKLGAGVLAEKIVEAMLAAAQQPSQPSIQQIAEIAEAIVVDESNIESLKEALRKAESDIEHLREERRVTPEMLNRGYGFNNPQPSQQAQRPAVSKEAAYKARMNFPLTATTAELYPCGLVEAAYSAGWDDAMLAAAPQPSEDARDAARLDWLDKQCSEGNGRHICCLPGGLRAAIDAMQKGGV